MPVYRRLQGPEYLIETGTGLNLGDVIVDNNRTYHVARPGELAPDDEPGIRSVPLAEGQRIIHQSAPVPDGWQRSRDAHYYVIEPISLREDIAKARDAIAQNWGTRSQRQAITRVLDALESRLEED